MSIEAKVHVYQLYAEDIISRSVAHRIIGDEWETVSKIGNIQRAREMNYESGYTSEELREVFS